MSQNIKLNPFDLVGTWNNNGLDFVGGAIPPVSPTIFEIAEQTAIFSSEQILFNPAQFAPIDLISSIGIAAHTINYATADSWCMDCCDNTFTSYEKIKSKINELGGFSSTQLMYINQIIGLPCNYKIDISDLNVILEQIETSVLVDTNINRYDLPSILLILAISKSSLAYWEAAAANASNPWYGYMIPPPQTDHIRPFWLANILGALIAISGNIGETSPNSTNNAGLSTLGLVGGIVNVSAYAVFK